MKKFLILDGNSIINRAFYGIKLLTTKDGLTASAVAEAILKLSALPIVGFKGSLAGYEYAKGAKCEWLETKSRLLEGFLTEENNHSASQS